MCSDGGSNCGANLPGSWGNQLMTYGKGIAIIGVAGALAAIAFPAIAADLVRYPTPAPRVEQPAPAGHILVRVLHWR